MAKSNPAKTYRWCDACRRSYSHADAPDGHCPVCAGDTREMGKFEALARGFMANEMSSSALRTKHRQIVRMIWTRNGMGEQYYRVVAPDVPYNTFETRVTDLLCQGAEEGWVRFVLPAAPSNDDAAYTMEFPDEHRFVQELDALFAAPVSKK